MVKIKNTHQKTLFFLRVYVQMIDITKETLEKNVIAVVVDDFNTLWLNEKHIEEQLAYKNLPAITSKHDKIYKKHSYELVDDLVKQLNRRFLRIDLALKITMDCRTDESSSLKRNLGFNLQDVINTKEQTVLKSLKNAFEGEDMQTQYTIMGYRIDLYFHKNKLVIEVDELGHANRYLNN